MAVPGNPYDDPDLAAAYEVGLEWWEHYGDVPAEDSPYPPGPITDAWWRGNREASRRSDVTNMGYRAGSGGVTEQNLAGIEFGMQAVWVDGQESGQRRLAQLVTDLQRESGVVVRTEDLEDVRRTLTDAIAGMQRLTEELQAARHRIAALEGRVQTLQALTGNRKTALVPRSDFNRLLNSIYVSIPIQDEFRYGPP